MYLNITRPGQSSWEGSSKGQLGAAVHPTCIFDTSTLVVANARVFFEQLPTSSKILYILHKLLLFLGVELLACNTLLSRTRLTPPLARQR